MQKIKVSDEVVVLSGKDRGKTGKVLKINKKTSKVLVQGINLKTKSVRAGQDNPQGGHTKFEGFIPLCKVAVCDPKESGRPTRIHFVKDGKNWNRVAVKSGEKFSSEWSK